MTLTLTVLRSPDATAIPPVRLEGGEFTIGRGSENDLVLNDPERHLSKRHCLLACRAGVWQVADLSANGTFHNQDEEPLGPGTPRELRDGDRLRLGPYVIEIRVGKGAGIGRLVQASAGKPPPSPARRDPPPAPARPAPVAPPGPVAAGSAEAGLLAAFLAGAGMAGVQLTDPEATMRGLGRAARAMVSGLRAALAARAEIKSEFRIDRTMVRARGNNPLKFSADDDDALAALLGAGRQTDMDAAAAISEALRDMRLHELASVAAMQAAVRTLLDQFDPERIRGRAEEGGGLAMMPAQRRARAWQVFERMHAETIRALADDFDSVFGKAFARAYEKAIREAREQGSGDGA